LVNLQIKIRIPGLLLTGELLSFALFIQRHPFIIYEMITFSIASALGQFFIFVMVSDFGPLPCSIVTTTRKFFTVLASVVFFGNVLTNIQWLGAVGVFAGLALDSVYGGK
jgi:UDP-galactose transporter B1